MKGKYLKAGITVILLLCIFSGCTSYKIQNVEVEGAVNKNAIKITEGNRKAFSMVANSFLSFNEKKTLSARIDEHSKVNSHGIYQVDPVEGQKYFIEPDKVNTYDFDGNNFFWNIPSATAGFELDFALSKYFSVWGGMNYSSLNTRNLFGGKFGFGFFTQSEHTASRLDVGFRFQKFFSNIEYLEILDLKNERWVYFHSLNSSETVNNIDLSFTFNTVNKPVDFFLNLTLGNQKFFSFSPSGTVLDEINHTSFSTSVCLGVFKKISDESRIIIGARYTAYNETGKTSVPDFFIQHDFLLF